MINSNFKDERIHYNKLIYYYYYLFRLANLCIILLLIKSRLYVSSKLGFEKRYGCAPQIVIC